MYTALYQLTGQKVTADEAEKGDSVFICQSCEAKLVLRQGLVRMYHFSHPAGAVCDYASESQEHLRIKKDIYQDITRRLKGKVRNIELEKPLGSVRPDIYIEGKKKKIAIEVQASALTPAQILYRTECYHRLGIYVLWVLPFDEDRFTTFSPHQGKRVWTEVKLKEYERIIMYMYFKTIVFWDLSHLFSDQFLAVQFSDSYTDSVEFYDRDFGEVRSFASRKLKTKKLPEYIHANVSLGEFQLTNAKEFKMPMAKYTLPRRMILSYNWDK